MQKLDSTNFDSVIESSDKPTLVKFYTDWCGPCKALTPIIEKIAEEKSEYCNFTEVNAEHQKDIVAKYGIRSVPTLLLFNGQTNDPIVISDKTRLGVLEAIQDLRDKIS